MFARVIICTIGIGDTRRTDAVSGIPTAPMTSRLPKRVCANANAGKMLSGAMTPRDARRLLLVVCGVLLVAGILVYGAYH